MEPHDHTGKREETPQVARGMESATGDLPLDLALLQRLTAVQLDQYAGELDQAMESHTKWLTDVNRTLVCRTPPHANDTSRTPHLLCPLGRWYGAISAPELRALPDFASIGQIHERMHGVARDLLLKSRQTEVIPPQEYDHLIRLSEELRRLMQTVRASLKQNLNVAANLMGKVLENAMEGIVITDAEGMILNVNNSFTRLTGYSVPEVLGQNLNIFRARRRNGTVYKGLWTALRGRGQWQGQIRIPLRSGQSCPGRLSIAAVSDRYGETSHYIGFFSNLGEEQESDNRLYHLAHYDQLTGLPNRLLFQDRLEQAIAHARRAGRQLAVMFLDLDGFKDVNDSLGHDAGDTLLKQAALRLHRHLRKSDTLARFGGDEFTVLLPEIDGTDHVASVAGKVVAEASLPYRLNGRDVHITASAGISLHPLHAGDAKDLIVRADAAMYEAKRQGKNRFCFHRPE